MCEICLLEKAEDFIGWKSDDGKLEVVGIAGKLGKITTFKVTCVECSKDPELFPDGYFISNKGNLEAGQKPCGCSRFNWKDWQYLILTRRAAEDRFIVHGFAEEFKNRNTKLNLECLKDGHKWTSSINNIIHNGSGCQKCSSNCRQTEQEALDKCIEICIEMNYEVVGFTNGYKNGYSRFEYNCHTHGIQKVVYNNFVNNNTRCTKCRRTPAAQSEDIALSKCIDKCKILNYTPLGFISEYRNADTTYFKYLCPIHGEQVDKYKNILNLKTPCKGCQGRASKVRALNRKLRGNGNGYFPERKDEQDFLYILCFGKQYIKVGRSFNVIKRIYEMESDSNIGVQDILLLGIYTDTHLKVYNMEQELHTTLKEIYYEDSSVKWSTECFKLGCERFITNYLKLANIECVL